MKEFSIVVMILMMSSQSLGKICQYKVQTGCPERFCNGGDCIHYFGVKTCVFRQPLCDIGMSGDGCTVHSLVNVGGDFIHHWSSSYKSSINKVVVVSCLGALSLNPLLIEFCGVGSIAYVGSLVLLNELNKIFNNCDLEDVCDICGPRTSDGCYSGDAKLCPKLPFPLTSKDEDFNSSSFFSIINETLVVKLNYTIKIDDHREIKIANSSLSAIENILMMLNQSSSGTRLTLNLITPSLIFLVLVLIKLTSKLK